jgi:DNA-binding winged helix-turn-helix (wHTH) protein/TolB-like protein
MDRPGAEEVYAFDGFRLDPGQRLLSRDGAEIPLSPKAVEILLVLVRHHGRIVSKNQLLDAVWKNVVVEESNLYSYLHILRNTLGNDRNGRPYVETMRRRGYRFNGDARPSSGGLPTHDDQNHRADGSPARPSGNHSIAIAMLVLAMVAGAVALFHRNEPMADSEPAVPIRTLAVLPFKPVSTGARNDPFQLGMADSLIGLLGNSDLIVRPIETVRRFGAPDQDPIAAGKVLGVDAVLDGTINVADGRIRVAASLWRVADGRQLWTGKFDEEFSGIFDIQDSISLRVANAVNA